MPRIFGISGGEDASEMCAGGARCRLKNNSPPVQAGQRTNGADSWYHLWFKRASRHAPLRVPSHTPRGIGRTRLTLLGGYPPLGKRLRKVFGEEDHSLAPTGCSLRSLGSLTGFHHSLDHIGVWNILYHKGRAKVKPCFLPWSFLKELNPFSWNANKLRPYFHSTC